MEIILTIWGIGIIYCIFEAIFYTELDTESKQILKNRDNEHKGTN